MSPKQVVETKTSSKPPSMVFLAPILFLTLLTTGENTTWAKEKEATISPTSVSYIAVEVPLIMSQLFSSAKVGRNAIILAHIIFPINSWTRMAIRVFYFISGVKVVSWSYSCLIIYSLGLAIVLSSILYSEVLIALSNSSSYCYVIFIQNLILDYYLINILWCK